MSRPWSKLSRELKKLISDDIDLQIHCVAYPMHSNYGSTDLPRYWITLGREIIWDYPKQFVAEDGAVKILSGFEEGYPYRTNKVIEARINAAKAEAAAHPVSQSSRCSDRIVH